MPVEGYQSKKYSKNITYKRTIRLNIYGRQPVLEALRSDTEFESLWISKPFSGSSAHQIRQQIERRGIAVTEVQKNEIQKISGPVVHQGIAATVRMRTIGEEDELKEFIATRTNPLLLVLDQIQDPHNLGAILRTAEICAVDAIILPYKGSAEITPTVAKTSAGALFHIPVFRSRDLMETFSTLHSMSIQLMATLPGAQNSMYAVDFTGPTAIIVGNEGQGVRKNLIPYCDQALYIPQFGKIQSLNASVSTAVVLYEALRQRNTPQDSKK